MKSVNLSLAPRNKMVLDARATPCYEVLVGGEHRKGAAMRPASELLAELSRKAKAAEDDAADVKSRNRAKLEDVVSVLLLPNPARTSFWTRNVSSLVHRLEVIPPSACLP